jgi:hypothetical protein
MAVHQLEPWFAIPAYPKSVLLHHRQQCPRLPDDPEPLVRLKIVEAAGFRNAAARRNRAISPEPGTTLSTTTHGNTLASLKVTRQ